MLFNSFPFLLLFLPAVLAGSWMIHSARRRVVFWTLASWTFYSFAGPWFLLLMIGSTVLDFTLAGRIARTGSPRLRRAYMVTSICCGLTVLGFFKYFNFFLDTVASTSATLHDLFGFPVFTASGTLAIVLPAGISFYTFETIRYTIDVYRREIEPERDFWYFACFVSLFPHLIAGPIIRPGSLIPQLHALPPTHRWQLQRGVLLFAAGLCKKVVLADRIALAIDPLLFNAADLTWVTAWLAMVGFAMQIYFDFSGYTDMARGLGCLLGIEFPVNFNSPYQALDPSDFWRRWHITLSTWLRDYLYIPLGGSRRGRLLTYRNLMITMLLGGLWHGAGWNFVVWGGLHGGALSAYHAFGRSWDRLPAPLRRAGMFTFVVLTWVPFRLHTLADIEACYRAMFTIVPRVDIPLRVVAITAATAALALFVRKNTNEIDWDRLQPASALSLGLVTYVALLYVNHSTQFLYFQF
jgi:alginate O-acetyltransferase complex protein AlgI